MVFTIWELEASGYDKAMSEDVRTFSTIAHLMLRTLLFLRFFDLLPSPPPSPPLAKSPVDADRGEGYMLVGVRGGTRTGYDIPA